MPDSSERRTQAQRDEAWEKAVLREARALGALHEEWLAVPSLLPDGSANMAPLEARAKAYAEGEKRFCETLIRLWLRKRGGRR